MALQSQMARSGMGSASRYSDTSRAKGKSGGKQLLGVALLGALVLGGGYWYMNGRAGAKTTSDAATGVPVAKHDVTSGPGSTLFSTPSAPAGGGASAPVIEMSGSGRGGREATPASSTKNQQAALSSMAQQSTPPAQPSSTQPSSTQPGSAPTSQAPSSQPPSAQPSGPGRGTTPSVSGGGGAGDGGTVRDPLAASGGSGGVNTGVMNRAAMPAEVAALVAAGEKAKSEGRLLDARKQLNAALLSPGTAAGDRAELRRMIAELNETLVFSKAVAPGDAMCESYTVEKGDSLVKIARKKQTVSEPGLIARINGMSSPNALRVGQTLKLVRGPFHAVVSKSAFRMDVYEGPVPSGSGIGSSNMAEGAEPGWTYIRSFPVGLGEKGTTPVANFFVKENSKLVNPFWVNPRTGEKFDADDPKNPIGERWIGLEGVSLKDKAFTGYGVHGTVDENSIGREMSMGCVRMHAADVEIVYELLMPRVSVVKVVE